MIRRADIDRLVALRRMREERADRAVARQADVCRKTRGLVVVADIALDDHAMAAEARERLFFEAILGRPMPQTALGRSADSSLAADHRRGELEEARTAVSALADAADETLRRLMDTRLERRRDADRLSEVARLFCRVEKLREEVLAELSAEDDATFRRRREC